jgi:hypothetical protein
VAIGALLAFILANGPLLATVGLKTATHGKFGNNFQQTNQPGPGPITAPRFAIVNLFAGNLG